MEYQTNIVLSIFLNSTFLVVWFLTNAFYEYTYRIIPIIFNEYKIFIIKNGSLYFSDYLYTKNNFLFKLLSCPFCIGFWSSLTCSIIYNCLFYLCVIYIISLMIFFIIKKICCT
jgi:hypothetical protein